jgi:hypothetical protein
MKSPEDLEKVLTTLGRAWPNDGSIVEKVMRGIEQVPPFAAAPKPRNILMKSILAIAASFLAVVALWWSAEGSRSSLYAQVMDAAHKARTIHIVSYRLPKRGAEPTTTLEAWFEVGVGFRKELWDATPEGRHYTTCLANKDGTWTIDASRKNTIVHSPTRNITKETERIFVDIDEHARHLQNDGEHDPQADRTFDDQPCKAYVLKPSDRSNLRLKGDTTRQVYYLDQQSRLVRVVTEERIDSRWKTTWFSTIAYDEPLGAAFFRPHFGKEFSTVEAGAEAAKPDQRTPAGPVLVYEIMPNPGPAGTAVDIDKVLRVVDARLRAGLDRLAAVRKLDEQRLEVTLLRRGAADRQRVERQLTRPGTLEFRILASKEVDQVLVGQSLKHPAQAEVRDASGKRVAWWVPVAPGHEKSFASYQDIVRRTQKQHRRETTEILVVADPCNVTGSYIIAARLQFNLCGEPGVSFTFNDAGGKLFAKLTGDHLPKKASDFTYKLGIILDGELFSAPSIQSTIGNKGQITGSFSEIDASDLAAVLNAGNLPVRLQLVEEHPQR